VNSESPIPVKKTKTKSNQYQGACDGTLWSLPSKTKQKHETSDTRPKSELFKPDPSKKNQNKKQPMSGCL
jgi:hypothetical protein